MAVGCMDEWLKGVLHTIRVKLPTKCGLHPYFYALVAVALLVVAAGCVDEWLKERVTYTGSYFVSSGVRGFWTKFKFVAPNSH